MDNNTNMNNGDFPDINSVKIEDTPAESFASLYGNKQTSSQQAAPTMTPNPAINPIGGVQQAPTQQAAPTMTPNPAINSMTGVAPVQSQVNNENIIEETNALSNGINVSQEINSNTAAGTMITPNNIDREKMQSIEEQLSKTSQYNPEDLIQEKIEVPTDNQYEKNKSGITFIVVLFVILALVIGATPFVIKFFS